MYYDGTVAKVSSCVLEKEFSENELLEGVEPMETLPSSTVWPSEILTSDVLVLEGHTSEVFACAWSPYGSLLASGSGDSTTCIWTIADGSCRSSIQNKPANVAVLKHFKGRATEKRKDVTTLDWNGTRQNGKVVNMRVMRTSDKVHSFKPWNCEQITLMLNLCSIRYANVKPVNAPPMRQWLQATVKNPPIAVETPSASDLGVQTGVYGALMALTYVNGTSSSSVPYGGVDVPGLILAGSFGASLYFMTKKNIKLGKATIITVGGLAAGAVVGSVVENWLQAYQLGSERRCSLVWSEELVTF